MAKKHALDGTIDEAEKAIVKLKTKEEVTSFREYEKEHEDRKGIYDLLDSKEESLKTEVANTKVEEEKINDGFTQIETTTKAQPIIEEEEDKDDTPVKEKIKNLKPREVSKLNKIELEKMGVDTQKL